MQYASDKDIRRSRWDRKQNYKHKRKSKSFDKPLREALDNDERFEESLLDEEMEVGEQEYVEAEED